MNTSPAGLPEAIALHQRGQLDEAEQIYRRILQAEPRAAQAMQLLGLIAYQRGNLMEAANLIETAVRLSPDEAEFHNNLGEVYRGLNRMADAAAAYERALRLNPQYAHAHNNLGLARKVMGDRAAARLAFQAAVRVEPAYAEAWTNWGLLEQEDGKIADAATYFERAVEANPGRALSYILLGATLRKCGRQEDALTVLRQAVRLDPKAGDAYYFLGLVLLEGRQPQAAAEQFSNAVALMPNFPEAYNSLGLCAMELGQFEEALVHFDRAVRLKSDYAAAYNNQGLAYREMGRPEMALACFRRSVALEPSVAHFQSNLLFALHYLPEIKPAEITTEHRSWAERHAVPLFAPIRFHAKVRRQGRPLRVGFVSPDFREHAVTRFLLPVLQAHRAEACEIYAYSATLRPDATTERIKRLVGKWRDIRNLTDAQAAELIREDQVDVLVDLAGHTANNRLQVFAFKPAPVQVSWLGYPNTTGLAAIDYRLVDQWSDPERLTDPYCVERLWRLPDTAWCYRPIDEISALLPKARLAAGDVAFGSFNNLGKVSSRCVGMWGAILREVPQAKLILKSKGLGEAKVREEVAGRFEREGVRRERLEFSPWTATMREHLEYYGQVDVALDTYPYHGTTTTCDALWMGVPVVTLAGEMHHARVGVSLLTNVGLPELVAPSPAEYVRVAVGLAQAPARLAELRAGLRARMAASPLRDEAKFAQQFEAAVTAMWERWSAASGIGD